MGVVTDSFFVDFLLVLILIISIVYWYISNNNGYWDNKGVPNTKTGFLMEGIRGKKSQSEWITDLYQEFAGERFGGFFQLKTPVLMVRDSELIHKILVKDFIHFQDRGQPELKNNPLSASLFNLRGQVWRALRYKLTPTFTTGKLKGMFEQVSKCGDHMIDKIQVLKMQNDDIECKAFLFEFTLDVISSCAFGVQFKPNSPEFNVFKSIVQKTFTVSPMLFVKFTVLMLFPKLAEITNLTPFPTEINNYFFELTRATSKYRKDNNIKRNDYFQLLLTLKEEEESGKAMGHIVPDTNEDDDVVNQMQYTEQSNEPSTANMKLFTEEAITANTFIFLLAGSESVSNTISLTLFELSQHQDIQERLQLEVDSVLARHGGWTYEAIKNMIFLDQVIQEAQRLYPVLPGLVRECVKPYKVPDTDLVIEKGVLISIPVVGLHKDPQHYPDPEQFKPERFEGNNFKPNPTFLPFGDGPRICIAMRFAVMEVKTCIARIMSQYSIKLSSKTQLPLKFNPRSFTPSVKDGIWLTFEERTTPTTDC